MNGLIDYTILALFVAGVGLIGWALSSLFPPFKKLVDILMNNDK